MHAEPGFEERSPCVQSLQLPVALGRDLESVGLRRRCKDSLFCATTEEFMLPVIHGNDRVEWFVQLCDEIIWDVERQRHRRAARARQ